MDHGIPFDGDVTLFAWAAAVAYPLTAAAALAAGSTLFDRATGTHMKRRAVSRRFWGLLAIGLILLFVDGRLGLADRAVEALRGLFRQFGMFDQRRALQALFIVFVAIAGAGGLFAVRAALGRAGRPIAVAAVAGAGLLVFAIVRAASLHHVDAVMAERVLGVPIAFLPEYALLATIAGAAFVERRIIRRRIGGGDRAPPPIPSPFVSSEDEKRPHRA